MDTQADAPAAPVEAPAPELSPEEHALNIIKALPSEQQYVPPKRIYYKVFH